MTVKINFVDYTIGVDEEIDLKTLYSHLKLEWIDNSSFTAFNFPLRANDSQNFEFMSPWQPDSQKTVDFFRNGRCQYTQTFKTFTDDDDLFKI